MQFTFRRAATIQVGEMNFDKIGMEATFTEDDFGGVKDPDGVANKAEMFINDRFDSAMVVMKNQVAARLVEDRMRLYDLNGKKVPSVTSILSFAEGFPSYPAGVAQRGTILHKYLERWAKTGQKDRFTFVEMMEDFPELAPEFKAVIDSGHSLEDGKLPAVIEKLEKEGYEFLETEGKVLNEQHEYGGRFDAVVRRGDAIGVLDFKCGASDEKRLKRAWQQIAALSKSDTVREKYTVTKMFVVPIDFENKVKLKDFVEEERIDMYFSLFLEKRERVRRELKI